MTTSARARSMKMIPRRRSPVMLAVSMLAAWFTAPAAAAASAAKRGRSGARADTTAVAPPFAEIPIRPDAAVDTTAAPARLTMIFQAGWQHMWPSTALWDRRSDNMWTLDLGMLARGEDGHRWGGAVSGFWYGGHRRNLGLKAIRRWTLEEASGSYLQVAPGVLATGDDERVDLAPGLLLEAELGNQWVALATGLQVQPWSGDRAGDLAGGGTDVIWTLGGRCHGALGLGAVAGLYLFILLAFAASGGGWD